MTEVHGVAAQAELLDNLFAPEPPPRRRRWPYAVLALAVVAAAAVAVVLVTRDDKPSGPPHPAKWDARVQDYVAIVGQQGGRVFFSPPYRSSDIFTDAQGRLYYEDRQDKGRPGLERAGAFIKQYHGAHNGRIQNPK